jgi:hypothetical protein
MYENSLLSASLIKRPKAELTSYQTFGRPGYKWEEDVKEDVARLLRCCNWKLIVQIGTFWRQKLWEVKG